MGLVSLLPLLVASVMRPRRDSLTQQIGPVSAGLLECSSVPPFGDFGVIAADQDLRHSPSAKLRWPGVMRIVEEDTSLDGSGRSGHGMPCPYKGYIVDGI